MVMRPSASTAVGSQTSHRGGPHHIRQNKEQPDLHRPEQAFLVLRHLPPFFQDDGVFTQQITGKCESS